MTKPDPSLWNAPAVWSKTACVLGAVLLGAPPSAAQQPTEPFEALSIHYAPAAVALAEPALAVRLSQDFATQAQRFLADAVATERERLELSRQPGAVQRPPFTRTFERSENALEVVSPGDRDPRLISVGITDFRYEGGAHPNTLR